MSRKAQVSIGRRMLILAFRTDQPESEIKLLENGRVLAEDSWQAHRQLAETLHQRLAQNLKNANKSWQDIGGVIVYKGPGSFTGLRIGLSVANALAMSQNIPIVGTSGKQWAKDGVDMLSANKNDHKVIPEYGAPAHITQPRR